jgi:hypothetical protein
MIKHIVFFKLKNRSDLFMNVKKLQDSLNALPSKINQIKYFETGLNITDSERSYDLSLISEFDSTDTLEEYRAHPEHQKVVELIKNICDSTAVVDYEI